MVHTPLMKLISLILTAIVALLHIGFLVLESILWTTPTGMEISGYSPEQAEITAVLALNQGAYNGILAAGLLWAVIASKKDVAIFFLAAVVFAGVVGAVTASERILFIQALPGALALLATLVARWRVG